MKPIIIKTDIIPKLLSIFFKVEAITLFPFIIIRKDVPKTTMRHERIHIEQQKELFLLGFFILYIWYWLRLRVQGKTSGEAYMLIPFEREAHLKQYDPLYVVKRKRNAWKLYTQG